MARRKEHGQRASATHSATAASVSEFRRQIKRWYKRHRRTFPWRRESASVYSRIVSEVLLQRTSAGVAGRFLPKFERDFPSWAALSRSSENRLARVLRPLGLWRRRAASLKALADTMAARGGRFPDSREELEKLPAVGQYVASAILLFRFGRPEPLLDANMARVLERYFGPRRLSDIRYDPHLQALARSVLTPSDAITMNWAILDLASLVCTIRNPRCSSCPLVACRARAASAAA